MASETPVVIVHGSYHQPAHYDPLAAALRARGRMAVVPDVGGLELPVATRAVQDVVDGLAGPPVVVGHSFGGAVAGALSGVTRMVFLSAWVLDTGETAAGFLEGATGGGAFAAALRPGPDDRYVAIDPDHAGDLFYDDCAPADRARAVGLLRPDVVANFGLPPVAARWHETPSLYVRTTRDRTWPDGLAERFAARCGRTVELPTAHSPFVNRPGDVADLLLGEP